MRVAVMGVGSAGILSLSHLLTWLPENWEVCSIHNPKIDIVGIGESTNPAFITTISKATDFHLLTDCESLDATLKFGTLFKQFREHDIMNPLIGGICAIHFNTHKFKDFMLDKLQKSNGDKFKQIFGNIENVTNRCDYVEVIIDGVEEKFDYVVDCRGFPKDYTDYTICDLPVNHCLVHNIMTAGDWQYTGHTATKNGWMFEVPLTSRQSYGYLFNDTITSKEEAQEDFSKVINVPVEELNTIEYKFKSYYTNQVFDGRILKNGNSAVFFEPMSATSLWLYDRIIRDLYDYIAGSLTIEDVNDNFKFSALNVRDMICYFYHGGSIHNTKFWDYAKQITSEIVKNSDNVKRCVEEFKFNKLNNFRSVNTPEMVFAAKNLKLIDENFEYNYFK